MQGRKGQWSRWVLNTTTGKPGTQGAGHQSHEPETLDGPDDEPARPVVAQRMAQIPSISSRRKDRSAAPACRQRTRNGLTSPDASIGSSSANCSADRATPQTSWTASGELYACAVANLKGRA